MTEIRALLLTDLVDSTKLSEQLGDARMAALWAAHDRVARDLLVAHGGREIDKTDGFLLLFEAPEQAAAYAVAYHRAIAALDPPVKARAGLHVGPVILTRNAPEDIARGAKPLEVDGLAKPIAARVMSVAQGGQTLSTVKVGPRVESHGSWRMKGVAEPLELFEIGDETAAFQPPPDGAKVYRVVERGGLWVPAREVPHHLPAERDAFVGRSADLLNLARGLETARLVSLLGMGGSGKTRLVLRFGWLWLGDYPGGVWFCDMSEARSVAGIATAVARALDVPLAEGDPIAQLGHAIAARGPCLLVLDNFEQVARHAGETLGRWLDRAGDARFVVTTREVLGLPGETTQSLAPLSTSESVDLFVTRARQAKPGFVGDDQEAIAALVRLLDGLPLAIELAAARVRVMAPRLILDRMGERFKVLSSAGGRHTRQATLRGALDWSWDLLSADEQSALAQLSVFEGGFTLEAAEGVLALAELWPMDAVQGLVDKSLVRQGGEDRFDLLLSVQEYAAEKLAATGDGADAEERHAAHYAQLGEVGAIDRLDGHGGDERRRALAQELDNVVVATRRCVARGVGPAAVSLVRAAWTVLALQGPFALAAELAELVVGMPSLSDRDRIVALLVSGGALAAAGRRTAAMKQDEAALASARAIGDPRREREALIAIGMHHSHLGHPEAAQAALEQALASARADRDRPGQGTALGSLGTLHAKQGREEAGALMEEALAICRETGNRRAEGAALGNLGNVWFHRGRRDRAQELYDQALAIHRELRDRRAEGRVLGNLGSLANSRGRLGEARAHFEAALAVHRQVGNRASEGLVLGSLGMVVGQLGHPEEARAAHEAALAIHRETGDRHHEGTALGRLGSLHGSQGRLDEARASFEAALAVHREVKDRRSEGHVLGNLGLVHARQGRHDEAAAHYEEALAIDRETGDRVSEGVVLRFLASLHLELGRPGDALPCLESALALQRAAGSRPRQAQVHAQLGSVLLELGRPEEARAHVDEGERLLRDIGNPTELASLLCVKARLEALRGDPGPALAEAKTLAAAAGTAPGSALALEIADVERAVRTSPPLAP